MPRPDAVTRLRHTLPLGVLLGCALLAVSCGKKGPPLPPLVKLPVAPADLRADRRGDTVDLQMIVPSTNTDSSRPANVSSIDVYAWTGSPTVTDAEVLKRGTKVATIVVKAPRDPDATTDPDSPDDPDADADVEPPEGKGLDQGAVARVREQLTSAVRAGTGATAQSVAAGSVGPLLGPLSAQSAARVYVSVGLTTRGRRGQLSRRVVVPLTPSPAPPVAPKVSYAESAITVSWSPAGSAAVQAAAGPGVLPSRLIGVTVPRLAYHVYEVPAPLPAAGGARANAGQAREESALTKAPISETTYQDLRMTWGATRCYAVRAIEIVDALAVESDETTPACVTLVDTFPPAAPKGLNVIAGGEGVINLIWDANAEDDLDGYIVLRGVAPATMLTRITAMPIHETTFHDTVRPGVRYVYAIQAVDKAGNVGPPSGRQEETAVQ